MDESDSTERVEAKGAWPGEWRSPLRSGCLCASPFEDQILRPARDEAGEQKPGPAVQVDPLRTQGHFSTRQARE